ncbi:glycoside hydrolase superfamily [Helicostylum pulchrum]|uniref:glucan endo-1,3-beta-D-glucosidase n=1 Tax=Helicostylum pulchrum TaxID=562976 RepID=A0ABP9XM14_9FUNG|nr:glycoside hydrolase superfamily [Helicostylum pulchrum]
MRFTSILTIALTFAGVIQSLPIETRGIGALHGVTYTARNSDGQCQTAQEIAASVKSMKSKGINNIRTYSQECNQLPAILDAINSSGGGMTVLAAVWIDGTGNDDQEMATLKSVLNSKDTGAINGILVGNEVIFKGQMSSSQLAKKIKTVKSFSKGIKVGTAEMDTTYPPDLMAASDIAAVNIHPYFSQVDVKDALSNLNDRYNNFKKLAHGVSEVFIAETGWPTEGASFGDAVPSVKNTQIFAAALTTSHLPYYFFEWQDSSWKAAGIESHFGLLNTFGRSKFAL